MYYVIQVAPRKEDEIEMYIMERISDGLYFSCFHPMRHVRKKFHGEWRDRHEKLFPGYVFINSGEIQELYLALKQIPMMAKLLGRDVGFVTALTDQEAAWLERIITVNGDGKIKAEVFLSQIEVDENDEIKILSGPLKDMACMVKRIDLHRRIAAVEVEFLGRKMVIHLGIEMIRKK